jgi:hypothetical protein
MMSNEEVIITNDDEEMNEAELEYEEETNTGANEKDNTEKENYDHPKSPQYIEEPEPSNGENNERVANEGLWPEYCDPSYRLPDKIEVNVNLASGNYSFPVIIEKSNSIKYYLGGYRNKLNGRIYHHATTQTPRDNRKAMKDLSNLRSRDTQTSESRTISIQCFRESGTQMERIDLCLDNRRDRIIIAKPYFTAAELLLKQKVSTIEIQRCWRGYMARCEANRLKLHFITLDREAEEERFVCSDKRITFFE